MDQVQLQASETEALDLSDNKRLTRFVLENNSCEFGGTRAGLSFLRAYVAGDGDIVGNAKMIHEGKLDFKVSSLAGDWEISVEAFEDEGARVWASYVSGDADKIADWFQELFFEDWERELEDWKDWC